MNLAFCYENVLPQRGGCETYISDLARRLVEEGHEVHLYASSWDASALPDTLHYHALPKIRGPRFLRPWRFSSACLKALAGQAHDVTIGFDKTWGQDVLYPQGGLHAASATHNLLKHSSGWSKALARLVKACDLAHWSYTALERKQYLREPKPLIVVNSNMVRKHFAEYYQVPAEEVRVVRASIDPQRFQEPDRLRRRHEARVRWGIGVHETVAVFLAMNYHLKGLEPLLHAVAQMPLEPAFRLLVAGSPRTRAYEKLAQNLGVRERVTFVGPVREAELAYFSADFLVHPTFYDPCSLVVLEALTCGLPVITSQYNGASELLTPGQEGYVVADPHDHTQLAWCMRQLLDSGRRIACAQAARRAGSQWTFEQHYQQMLQVFTEAALRKQAA